MQVIGNQSVFAHEKLINKSINQLIDWWEIIAQPLFNKQDFSKLFSSSCQVIYEGINSCPNLKNKVQV